MLEFYRDLGLGEKILLWVAAVAVISLVIVLGEENDGIAAGAQVAAAVGTFVLAGLALSQVREMKEARLAQERPQVIVDLDQSKPPFVYVVVRNIGQGAAKNITFEFSAPMEMPEGKNNPYVVPVNEQGYFKRGMAFLAPGAEIRTLWGSMITLGDFLRERGMEAGVTITSRYQALSGERHTTEWAVNPLLLSNRISTEETDIEDVIEALDKISNVLQVVVDPFRGELVVSTESERRQRQSESDGEGG